MDFLQFKLFCRDVIESGNHPLPVKVEMLNIGMTPFFETEIQKDYENNYRFSKELAGNFPVPFTVRFTPEGKQSFLRDLPTA